jgi:undecaprenyl-diphosphatase
MVEILQSIDTYLFYAININFSNSVFDKFFPFITESRNWTMLYIFYLAFLVWKCGIKGRKLVVLLFFTILISDQLSSHVIKELVGRIRPCHELPGVHLLADCGGGKSFPSSHAVNNFAAATVISYFYKEYKYILFVIAGLVAFSRVYVGVHYPLDILAGAIIGFGVGYFITWIDKKYISKYTKF